MSAEEKVRAIEKIACLDELDGYENQAKKRGLLPEELTAIYAKRAQLTPKKRRRR